MINVMELNGTCTKIAVLLEIAKISFDKSSILYCLAISDFVQEDGLLKSKSIRNINSIRYYSEIINSAINKMILYKLIIPEGNLYKLSCSGMEFVKYCEKQNELQQTICKLNIAYEKSISGESIKIYNELYKIYLKEKISVGGINR